MTGVRHWQFGRGADAVPGAAWRAVCRDAARPHGAGGQGRGHASIRCRRVDVLVATTVVVGGRTHRDDDMVVMDADRFGVSQLHQLRGRVGRGTAAGICLLVTDIPAGSPARERLEAVAASQDGFELSRVDLEQRREDVLGASQSGRRSSLRLLGVIRDEDIIRAARSATALVDADPELARAPPCVELEALLEAEGELPGEVLTPHRLAAARRRSTDPHPRTRYPTNVGPDPRSPRPRRSQPSRTSAEHRRRRRRAMDAPRVAARRRGLVESDRACGPCATRNVDELDLDGAQIAAPCPRASRRRAGGVLFVPGPYHIAFLDPPYSQSMGSLATVLRDLRRNGWLAEGQSSPWALEPKPRLHLAGRLPSRSGPGGTARAFGTVAPRWRPQDPPAVTDDSRRLSGVLRPGY